MAWTLVYNTSRYSDIAIGNNIYYLDMFMQGAYWHINPVQNSYMQKFASYVEVPFSYVKLGMISAVDSTKKTTNSFSLYNNITTTNNDWKIFSLFNAYARSTGIPRLKQNDGQIVIEYDYYENMKIIQPYDYRAWGKFINSDSTSTDKCVKAGFRIVTRGIQYEDDFGALLAYYHNTISACTSKSLYLIGTGFSNSQFNIAPIGSDYHFYYQGALTPIQNIDYQYQMHSPVNAEVMVSEGSYSCSEKNYCLLNGRCIAENVCDCMYDYSGNDNCAFKSVNDQIFYLKGGSSRYLSLTNRYHALVEDNVQYVEGGGFSLFSNSYNGTNSPHLTIGAYSEPLNLTNSFTLVFTVKFTSRNSGSDKYYAFSHNAIDSTGKQTSQLDIYFTKESDKSRINFVIGDYASTITKEFSYNIFDNNFRIFTFTKSSTKIIIKVSGDMETYTTDISSVSQGSWTKPGILTIGAKPTDFGASSNKFGYNNGFISSMNGIMKDIMLFNSSLGDNYISHLLQNQKFCFGKFYDDPLVCSGSRSCVDYNVCECVAPFRGENCMYFRAGVITSTDTLDIINGIPTYNIPFNKATVLHLKYSAPLSGDNLFCVLGGTPFKVEYLPGSLPDETLFTCTVKISSLLFSDVQLYRYTDSPTPTRISGEFNAFKVQVLPPIEISLNASYSLPSKPINLNITVSVTNTGIDGLRMFGETYSLHYESISNSSFIIKIDNPVSNINNAYDTQQSAVELYTGTALVANNYTFYALGRSSEPIFLQRNFNALLFDKVTLFTIKSFGIEIPPVVPTDNFYCSFDGNLYIKAFKQTNGYFVCNMAASTVGYHYFQLNFKTDDFTSLSLPKEFYAYKSSQILSVGKRIFLKSETYLDRFAELDVSQFSIDISQGYNVSTQIKCSVNGVLHSITTKFNGNNLLSLTCNSLVFNGAGAYSLNLVHDYGDDYLVLSTNNVTVYSFDNVALSPAQFIRAVGSSGEDIELTLDKPLVDISNDTSLSYQIFLKANSTSFNKQKLNYVPIFENGFVKKFKVFIPTLTIQLDYSLELLISQVGVKNLTLSETVHILTIAQQNILPSERNYFTLTEDFVKLKVSPGIPPALADRIYCEFNGTYRLPVRLEGDLTMCNISSIGTVPGKYRLQLVSELAQKLGSISNSIDLYAIGNYSISYYTPSIIPAGWSYQVQCEFLDPVSSFFFDEASRFSFYFKTSVTEETFLLTHTTGPSGRVVFSSVFKLPSYQSFTLVISIDSRNFTLNSFPIHFLTNTFSLELHSTSDFASLINDQANVAVTTNNSLLTTNRDFLKCRSESIYYNIEETGYPSRLNCIINYSSSGYKGLLVVYRDNINPEFELTVSIQFPVINPSTSVFKSGTNNIQALGDVLVTSIVSNTWLPEYLHNYILCVGSVSNNISTTLGVSNIAMQEAICSTNSSLEGTFGISLKLKINNMSQKTIALVTNQLSIKFISKLQTNNYIRVEPVLALYGKSIQPIINVDKDIPVTDIIDLQCLLVSALNSTVVSNNPATRISSKEVTCQNVNPSDSNDGNYLIKIVAVSKFNTLNQIDLFYSYPDTFIQFVNQKNLALHSSSRTALPTWTYSNVSFVNWLGIPLRAHSQLKFKFDTEDVYYNTTSINEQLMQVELPTKPTSGYISVNLWFVSSVSSLFNFKLSATSYLFPIISKDNISFNPVFSSGALVDQSFVTKVRFSGFLGLNSSLNAPRLHEKVYCSIGDLYVKASRYDYIDINISEFECTLRSSTAGLQPVCLHLDSNTPRITLCNNSIPAVIVKSVSIENVSPFTSLISQVPINLTISTGASLDYGDSVKYFCRYNTSDGFTSQKFSAVKESPQNFKCLVTSTPTSRSVAQIWMIIQTKETTDIVLSSNTITYYFQEIIPLTYVNPFVGFLNYSNPFKTYATVGSNVELFTDRELYCQYISSNQTIRVSKASFVANTHKNYHKLITCSIEKDIFELSNNIDYIKISLMHNGSLENSFVITKDIDLVLIKTPMSLVNQPTFFQKVDINSTRFSLSFDSPKASANLNISLTMDYNLLNNTAATVPLNCSIEDSHPSCTFTISGICYQTPQNLSFTVKVHRMGQEEVYSQLIPFTYYYISETSIKSAFPFILDYNANNNQATNIKFYLEDNSPLLNTQNFSKNYVCESTGNNQPKQQAVAFANSFNCLVKGALMDRSFVSVKLNFNATQIEQTITPVGENVEYSSLKFVDEHTRKDGFDSHLLHYNDGTNIKYSVPIKYRNNLFKLKFNDTVTDMGFNTFPCDIDYLTGYLNCTKGILYPDIGSRTIYVRGVQFANPYLTYNSERLTDINKPFILYNPSSITIFPLAALRQTTVKFEITFGNNTLDISLDTYPYFLNCLVGDEHEVSALLKTTKLMECEISLTSRLSTLNIVPILTVPTFFDKNITLSNNSANIYLFNQHSLSYVNGAGEESIFVNLIQKTISIKIDTTIPEIIKNNSFVTCKVQAYNTFTSINEWVNQNYVTTDFWKYENGFTYFNCTLKANNVYLGPANVSLHYVENSYSFELGNNSLPLYIVGFYNLYPSPMVSSTNKTVIVNLQSEIFYKQTTIDYGIPVKYYARYFNDSNNNDVKDISIDIAQPKIQLFSMEAMKLGILLLVELKGTNVTSTQKAPFHFLDGFYFEPNHGLVKGKEYLTLQGHTYNEAVDKNKVMRFKNYKSIVFSCTPTAELVLNCTTPDLTSTPVSAFTSHPVEYEGKELAAPFVVYDKIDAHLKEKIFPISIINIEATIISSKFIFVNASSYFTYVIQSSDNDPFPRVFQIDHISPNISLTLQTQKTEGAFEGQLFFNNEYLFVQNGRVAISDKETVYVLNDQRDADFLDSKTLFYIEKDKKETQSIRFRLGVEKFPTIYSLFVVCKTQDGTIFNTEYDPYTDIYRCNVSSTNSTSKEISIWLEKSDAYKGGFQISRNSLRVLFIEKIQLLEAKPYAIVALTSSNIKYTLSKMETNSVEVFTVAGVNIKCHISSGSEGSGYVPFYDPIVITNEYVICPTTKTTNDRFTNVKLVAYNTTKTSYYSLDISSNSIRIEYYEPSTVIRTYPFVEGIDMNFYNSNATYISYQTLHISNVKMLTKDLYCVYSINGESTNKIATAFNISTSYIQCNIDIKEQSLFADRANLVDISLVYKLTNDPNVVGEFSGSSNVITFEILRTPLYFKVKSAVDLDNSKTTDGLLREYLGTPISTNIFVPALPFDYIIQSGDAISLSCTAPTYQVVQCVFSNPHFATVPSPILSTVTIIDKRSNLGITFPIDSMLYYERFDFTLLYPFILPFREQNPKKIYYNFDRLLSNTYQYYLEISSSSINTTYPSIYEGTDLYSSTINTVGMAERVNLYFGFLNPKTNSKVLLTERSSNIQFIDKVILEDSSTHKYYSLPIYGGSIVECIVPNLNPTSKSLFTNYNFALNLLNQGKYLPLSNNFEVQNTGVIRGLTPKYINSQFASLPNNFGVDLTINNVRAFTFFGKITMFDYPVIDRILPSDLILTNQETITLQSNQFTFATVVNATIFYNCSSYNCHSAINNGNMETQRCSQSIRRLLDCISPKFIWDYSLSNTLPVSIALTLNGKDIFSIHNMLTLHSKSTISIDNVNEIEFDKEYSKTIYIFGSSFYDTTILVKLYDSILTRIIPATFINSQTISFKTPLLYDVNILFPRRLKIGVSFDNGKTFLYNQNVAITCNNMLSSNIIVQPLFAPTNTTVDKLLITNFRTSSITLEENEKLVLELYNTNQQYASVIDCTHISTDTLNCNFTTPPIESVLELRAKIVNGAASKPFYISYTGKVVVFKQPTLSLLSPSYIFKTSDSRITMRGSFPVVSSSNIRLLLIPSTSTRKVKATSSQNIDVTGAFKIDVVETDKIEMVITNKTTLSTLPGLSSLQMSVDSGTTYVTLTNEFRLVEDFTLISLRNDLSTDSRGIFTFISTPCTIVGFNFPFNIPQSEWKIRFTTKLHEKVYSVSNLEDFRFDVPSQMIMFKTPTFENFINGSDITTTFSFPMDVDMGVSFNSGNDFKSLSTQYLDRYQEVLVTSVVPNIIPRMSYELRIEGASLNQAKSCLFTSTEFQTGQSDIVVPVSVNSTTVITCVMPLMPKNVNTVSLRLINLKDELSKSENKIIYYENPILLPNYNPNTIPTHALNTNNEKQKVSILVDNYRTDLSLYIKYGTIFTKDSCSVIQKTSFGTYLSCPIQAHEAGTVSICVSYNRQDWYSLSGNLCDSDAGKRNNITMTYYPCQPGETSNNFKEICQKCPKGTYKPSAGIYACVECEYDHYNPKDGATSCIGCPRFSITQSKASTNLTQCLCLNEYYHNPNRLNNIMFLDPLDYYCIPCPLGATCNQTGTIKPVPNYGFWSYNESVYTEYQFYECFPHESCGGLTLNNCSNGYTGINCGVCKTGYYRWKNVCQECESYSWLKILLLLALIGLISVGFLAVSSIKISHLASISIAFSYTQIISMFSNFDIQWPWAMGNVFVASSVTNFNFSFVSPECWIPDISYFTRWLITSLLPFYFAIAFMLLYIFGILRSIFAANFGHKIKWKYMAAYEDEEENPNYDEELENRRIEYITGKQKVKHFIMSYIQKIGRVIVNFLIWLRNFGVWCLKQKQSKDELRVFLNMILNAYTAFLSFCFVFIMENASQTFVCNKQSTGDYTLQASPDILCFSNDSRWLTMLPISIIFYVIFGLGGILFFIAIYIMKERFAYKIGKLNRDEEGNEIVDLKNIKITQEKIRKEKFLLQRDPVLTIQYKNFYQRLKFMIKRFRRKFFYWEAVITARKLIISILHIFLKPLLVVVFAIFVVFIAMILHTWSVPFKHKFHNVSNYLLLI